MAHLDTCVRCRFFQPPKAAPKGVDVSREVNGVFSKGVCNRFPKFESRAPGDVCGEFSGRKN